MDFTPLRLTALGLFHTIVSVVAVAAAIVALIREGEISTSSGIGRLYLWSLVIACLSGLPIFRHGGIQPPHLLVASSEAASLKPLYLALFVLFVVGATLQVGALRAARRGACAVA